MSRPTQCSRHRLARALAVIVAAVLALVLTALPVTADAVRDRQWHLGYLSVPQAHELTRGLNVTVAVIDGKAEIKHPDLADNALPGQDFISGVGEGRDPGHAIAVASLIAGHGHGRGNSAGVLGIAPKARILPARAYTDPLSVADAVRWVVDQGATIINLSYGLDVDEIELREAISYAQAHDVVVVGAVGNVPQGDEDVIYPAAYPGVIAVSAVDSSGRLSNVSVSGEKVDLAAPGAKMQTADEGDGYSVRTGTSHAAPIVAGTAALIRARYPEMNAASVVNRLVKTADDKGPKGKDPQYGHGIVNPVRALTTDIPDVQQNPLGSLAKPSPTATAQPGAGGTDDGGGGLNPSRLLTWVLGIVVIVGSLIALVVWLARRRPGQAGTSRPPPGSPSPHGPPPHGPPPGYPPPRAGPPGGQPYGQGPPPGPPPSPPPQGPPPGWQSPPGQSPPR